MKFKFFNLSSVASFSFVIIALILLNSNFVFANSGADVCNVGCGSGQCESQGLCESNACTPDSSGFGADCTCTTCAFNPPVDGACSSPASHYTCSAGTSVNNVDGANTWTWSCAGLDGGANSPVCTENKHPDLTASSAIPTSISTGVSTTFSSTISNIGPLSTGASFSNFFQIASASNGGGTITDKTSSTMTTLAAGATSTTTTTHTFNSVGTYSARACADKSNSGSAGVITESNENNNCGAWVNVTVTGPAPMPDLTVGTATATPVSPVTTGTSVTFSATVSNIGTLSTGAVSVPNNLAVNTQTTVAKTGLIASSINALENGGEAIISYLVPEWLRNIFN